MIRIVNATTGEVIEREPNAEELTQMQIDEESMKTLKNMEQNKNAAKLVLLTKLGISADEAALLLG